MRRVSVAAALLAAVACIAPPPAVAEAETVAEPDGYRMDAYRAPVPATLAGAEVLDTRAAHALWRDGDALFIDVLPTPRRPADLPEGTLWRQPKRHDIPGSVWLANTGYGALSGAMTDYFTRQLERLTGGNVATPLVFYCQADCWMSWNAAKRALGEGYERVLWYPDGTDGWAQEGLPLEEREPVPTDDEG